LSLLFSIMNIISVPYCCSKIYTFLDILWHSDLTFIGLGLWLPHTADHLFMGKGYHAAFLCSAQHPCYSGGVSSSGRQTFEFHGISWMDWQLWGLSFKDNLMVHCYVAKMIRNWKQCSWNCPQIIYKCMQYINMQLFCILFPTRNLLENIPKIVQSLLCPVKKKKSRHVRARTHTQNSQDCCTSILKTFVFGTSFHFFKSHE
jgi:hypothetical protein